MHIITYI